MARLRGHNPLDAKRPLYVKRDGWTYGGRTLAKGERFDWRALGVPPRKLHQLWSMRFIGHEKPEQRNGAEDPTALVAPPEPPRTRKRKQPSPDDLSDEELELLTRPG